MICMYTAKLCIKQFLYKDAVISIQALGNIHAGLLACTHAGGHGLALGSYGLLRGSYGFWPDPYWFSWN
jgi:hypothetical protein